MKSITVISFIFLLSLLTQTINAQTTLRYQNNITGGVTVFGNSWYYSTSSAGGISTRLTPDIDGDATTAHSTSADLLLPTGSTIIRAYLSIERGLYNSAAGAGLTSVKLKVPGAASYQTLTPASPLHLVHRTVVDNNPYHYGQNIFDITSLMPANGYVSTAGGGVAGRYFVADPIPVPNINSMGGWSIIVVYTNPASKFRSVTVADNWQVFRTSTVTTDITGITIPSSGTVKAVVGLTGTYGDRGNPGDFWDYLQFGLTTGPFTNLADPTTGANTNVLNSSIGMTSQNNVSSDGGPALSGNITTRNPVSASHIYGPAESWEYDADICDASGILTPSSTPVNIRISQTSTDNDILASGSYFIAVDLAPRPTLTKSVSPSTISNEGTATYTFSITNTTAGNVAQTGIAFTDNLPAGLIIAPTPNVTITGGSGSTTGTPGSNSFSVSGFSIAAGATATITVNVTNVPGQYNNSCVGNPPAFTNTAANISGLSSNLQNIIGNVCLAVACNAGSGAPVPTSNTISNTCPGTTADLTTLQPGPAPAGTTYQWHTDTPGTSLNVYNTPTMASAGIYYLTINDAANNCRSATSAAVTVTITNCCAANAGTINRN